MRLIRSFFLFVCISFSLTGVSQETAIDTSNQRASSLFFRANLLRSNFADYNAYGLGVGFAIGTTINEKITAKLAFNYAEAHNQNVIFGNSYREKRSLRGGEIVLLHRLLIMPEVKMSLHGGLCGGYYQYLSFHYSGESIVTNNVRMENVNSHNRIEQYFDLAAMLDLDFSLKPNLHAHASYRFSGYYYHWGQIGMSFYPWRN